MCLKLTLYHLSPCEIIFDRSATAEEVLPYILVCKNNQTNHTKKHSNQPKKQQAKKLNFLKLYVNITASPM